MENQNYCTEDFKDKRFDVETLKRKKPNFLNRAYEFAKVPLVATLIGGCLAFGFYQDMKGQRIYQNIQDTYRTEITELARSNETPAKITEELLTRHPELSIQIPRGDLTDLVADLAHRE